MRPTGAVCRIRSRRTCHESFGLQSRAPALRSAFSDNLVLRYGSAMQPTVQAEQMVEAIAVALQLLTDRLEASGPLVPATSTQTFTFAESDFTTFALSPSLSARVEPLAPNLHLAPWMWLSVRAIIGKATFADCQ